MSWGPPLAEQQPLRASRIGFRAGEVRVFLRPLSGPGPVYALVLEGVAAFTDDLPRGAEVRLSDWPEHGSFGWWLPASDRHHSVKVWAVDRPGFLLALARRVGYRLADEAEAVNWPG